MACTLGKTPYCDSIPEQENDLRRLACTPHEIMFILFLWLYILPIQRCTGINIKSKCMYFRFKMRKLEMFVFRLHMPLTLQTVSLGQLTSTRAPYWQWHAQEISLAYFKGKATFGESCGAFTKNPIDSMTSTQHRPWHDKNFNNFTMAL